MANIQLKGGAQTSDPRLGRIPQFDQRSRLYPIRTFKVAGKQIADHNPQSKSWDLNEYLDQGSEGRCVEYSICHELLAQPEEVELNLVEQILAGKLIYWPAQHEDEWEGGSYPDADPFYEGTSVLAGIRVTARLGFYTEYHWAFSLEDAVVALGHVGPLVLGMNWYDGMSTPDEDGFLPVTGEIVGGHAILSPAITIKYTSLSLWERIKNLFFPGSVPFKKVNLEKSYLTLHNSWGPLWGENGRAKLKLADFDRLRKEGGEVCLITGRSLPQTLSLQG